MTEEFIYDRERELLDYIRNNIADPENRGTNVVDEVTNTTAGQTVLTFANTYIKNVADTITLETYTTAGKTVLVSSVVLYKGYHYNVTYGEGAAQTILTLVTPATTVQRYKVSYHYGQSLVEREYSREDTKLPRVILMFLTGSDEDASLGDYNEYGLGTYFNVSFQVEIRSLYASQARMLSSKLFNIAKKMRHANLFRLNYAESYDMQNFDYDPDKNCYIWQFTMNLQYEINFG